MNELFENLLNCSIDMKRFVGDCVTGLDDPTFQDTVAADVTELVQLVEWGEEITWDDFYNIADVEPGIKKKIEIAFESGDTDDYMFYYHYDRNIAWIYDNLEDVEYFYV